MIVIYNLEKKIKIIMVLSNIIMLKDILFKIKMKKWVWSILCNWIDFKLLVLVSEMIKYF